MKKPDLKKDSCPWWYPEVWADNLCDVKTCPVPIGGWHGSYFEFLYAHEQVWAIRKGLA